MPSYMHPTCSFNSYMDAMRDVYLKVFAANEAAVHVKVGERNRAELLEIEVKHLPQERFYISVKTVTVE